MIAARCPLPAARYLLQRRLAGDGARWRPVLQFSDDQAPQVQRHAEGLARLAAVEWRVVDADAPMVRLAQWSGGGVDAGVIGRNLASTL